MALNLGSPAGNPGYSIAAPRYNQQTGQYEGGGAVWMGQGQAPAGSQAQFQDYLRNNSIVNPANVGFINQVPQYGAGTVRTGVQPGSAPYQPPVKQPGYGAGMLAGLQGSAQQGLPAGQPGTAPASQPLAGQTSTGQPLAGQVPAGQPLPGQPLPGQPLPGQQVAGAPSSYGGAMQAATPQAMSSVPQTGLMGSEAAMRGGLAGAISGLEAGVNQAQNTLSPYTSAGSQANSLQAALSGASGPEAQRQAFANYNESPEVAYQREMGERAITRNAAATGGLGGSRVQQELQRHAIGLAQQDYGNSFNRLGSLSDKGYGAAGALGGIQANAGGQAGQYAYGTGQAMSSGRTRAGEQIAGNVANTSSALGQLINQQGTDLSSLIGTQGGNIANLLAGYGSADAQTQQALATLLANIASGSASQVAGVPGLPGVNDPGVLAGIGQLAGGVGGFMQGWKA